MALLLAQMPPDFPKPAKRSENPANVLTLAKHHLAKADSYVIEGKDTITFLYKAHASGVSVSSPADARMERLGTTDYWASTIAMPGAARALFSFGFVVSGPSGQKYTPAQVFQGSKAPTRAATVAQLKGSIQDYTLDSRSLGEKRKVTVYVPPGVPKADSPVMFMSDGQLCRFFARALEKLILEKRVKPVIIVGVHPDGRYRTAEYAPRQEPDRFKRHLDFFNNEVVPWAERELPISKRASDRALLGFSNGAEFVTTVAVSHPERFYWIMPFSMSNQAPPDEFWAKDSPETARPVFFMAAGSLEEGFLGATIALRDLLKDKGYRCRLKFYPCPHDPIQWQLAFSQYIVDIFPAKRRS